MQKCIKNVFTIVGGPTKFEKYFPSLGGRGESNWWWKFPSCFTFLFLNHSIGTSPWIYEFGVVVTIPRLYCFNFGIQGFAGIELLGTSDLALLTKNSCSFLHNVDQLNVWCSWMMQHCVCSPQGKKFHAISHTIVHNNLMFFFANSAFSINKILV